MTDWRTKEGVARESRVASADEARGANPAKAGESELVSVVTTKRERQTSADRMSDRRMKVSVASESRAASADEARGANPAKASESEFVSIVTTKRERQTSAERFTDGVARCRGDARSTAFVGHTFWPYGLRFRS